MHFLSRALSVAFVPDLLDLEAMMARYAGAPYVALLENPGEPSALGRYSFLGAEPFWIFEVMNGRALSGPPGALQEVEQEPLAELRALLKRFAAGVHVWEPGFPPLVSGAVGYLGYEWGQRGESVAREDGSLIFPDAVLMFCGLIFAVDLVERKGWVFATGFGETQEEAQAQSRELLARGQSVVDAVSAKSREEARTQRARYRELAESRRAQRPRLCALDFARCGVVPQQSRASYLKAIAQARERIMAGDIFEVCLTQRMDVCARVDGAALYRVLRAVNAAPMGAYLRVSHGEVLCASPERFVSLCRGRIAQTKPIKGTRPRGRNAEEDRAWAAELRASAKDRAENMMIVDLARNDLGRVCVFGSICVVDLCAVEPYAYTWQMVSTIEGKLRSPYGALDLVCAAFPGGSMTGAPKIEAMKIIAQLEPGRRGVFSGSVGYFDFDGAMDLNIVIRTLLKKGQRLSFHVGGAIVADSDPEDEYQETLDKAHGLVLALEIARETGLLDSFPGEEESKDGVCF